MKTIVIKETDIFKIASFIVGSGIGLVTNNYKILIKETETEIIFNNVEIDRQIGDRRR